MEFELNAVECRILGVLIEKQMATPEYYPLTLNALVNGLQPEKQPGTGHEPGDRRGGAGP